MYWIKFVGVRVVDIGGEQKRAYVHVKKRGD